MLPQQIALVSETRSVAANEVMRVAAALQKQAARDLAPLWGVSANISGFASLDEVPLGYWPIIVMENVQGAAGYHEDEDGQPFAVVEAGDSWSLTASHENCEMLVDPFGRRLVAGCSPKPDQSRVQFLVEVCDPSEDETYGYTVNGVLVSDFYTPSFFDPNSSSGVRYSFTGAIEKPRQVLKNGYLSWRVPSTKHWWQLTWFDAEPEFKDLGVFTEKESLRAQLDKRRPEMLRLSSLPAANPVLSAAHVKLGKARVESNAWAQSLKRQIATLRSAH